MKIKRVKCCMQKMKKDRKRDGEVGENFLLTTNKLGMVNKDVHFYV